MSQISNKFAKVIKGSFHRGGYSRHRRYEPGESASSTWPSRDVGDSAQTTEGRRITNKNMTAAGTFTLLILFGLAINITDVHAYTASITTSGATSIDVSPSGNASSAGTAISSNIITVNTTCRSGYNLTMSSSVSDNNLYLDGNSSNNQTGTYFTPADGTTVLSNTTNAWGYYYNSTNATAPTANSVFNAVPASGTTVALVSPLDVPSGSDISDALSVYYGVSVDSTLPKGTYRMMSATSGGSDYGGITYYLTMADACVPYVVNFSPTSTAGDISLSGAGTMSGQEIYKDASITLTNGFTAPDGYEFKEWNTKQDGTGTSYTDGQSATNLASPGGSVTLYAQWKQLPQPLYNLVANQVKTNSIACTTKVKDKSGNDKCAQTLAQMQAVINVPTSGATPATDTSNSGVFLYDASVFGAASDAANTSDIYYFRGILDSNLNGTSSTYGSNGDSAYYQNYVRLGGPSTFSTCWRIVRTTGSGGVKMIYNGNWTTDGDAGTCANVNGLARMDAPTYFNRGDPSNLQNGAYGTNGFIVYVGYNYNGTYGYNNTNYDSTTDNSIFFTNGTASNARVQVESWYDSNLAMYTDILETSAGYCNDRTTYSSRAASAKLTTSNSPYKTSTVYFGAVIRNYTSGSKLSLTCPNTTGYDLLTTSNGLGRPVALLTADEAALAGSGQETYKNPTSVSVYSSNWAYNSYLVTITSTHTLSPFSRANGSTTPSITIFYLSSRMNAGNVSNVYGLRPVVSLAPGTTPTSGSGTATDPWVVSPPSS